MHIDWLPWWEIVQQECAIRSCMRHQSLWNDNSRLITNLGWYDDLSSRMYVRWWKNHGKILSFSSFSHALCTNTKSESLEVKIISRHEIVTVTRIKRAQCNLGERMYVSWCSHRDTFIYVHLTVLIYPRVASE